MTNAQYTLADEEFARFVSNASQALAKREIPHVVVGNVAVQAHVLSLASRGLRQDIPALIKQANSPYLRPTNKLDIAIIPSNGVEAKLIDAQQEIAKCTLDFDGNRMFDYKLTRSGAKRATFDLEDLGHSIQPLVLKIIHGPNDMGGFGSSFYVDSVSRQRSITLSYGADRSLPEISVMAPPYLFAAKIDRLKEQDLTDIGSLATALNRYAKGVNQTRLRVLLGEQYKANFEMVEGLFNMGKPTAS